MNVPLGVKHWARVQNSAFLCQVLPDTGNLALSFFSSSCSGFKLTTFLYYAFTRRPSYLILEENISTILSSQYGRIKVDVAQFGNVAEAMLNYIQPNLMKHS